MIASIQLSKSTEQTGDSGPHTRRDWYLDCQNLMKGGLSDGYALQTRQGVLDHILQRRQPIRESTGTSKQKEAERVLKDREGRVAIGAHRYCLA